jgi:hypothetical protein
MICFLFELVGQESRNQSNWGFKGQMSSWAHLNTNNPYPFYMGARFLPQGNYELSWPKGRMIDFEASFNAVGDMGIHLVDSMGVDGSLSAYRIWGRYSSEQFEWRMGLQKINFGSATLLRPLMWFDQVDPRDPLKLTDGVWAALGRYYFLNNANVWVWFLYGNTNTKGWELIKSNSNIPEFGVRFQTPVSSGEAALSFHHRVVDVKGLSVFSFEEDDIPETRMGIDARFDKIIGFWFEGAWIHKHKSLSFLTNQRLLNVGVDYTFGVGNGLSVIVEHLVSTYDERPFTMTNVNHLTALSANYPFGLFDHVNAIVYYNYNDSQWYNFVNWSKQYDRITLNVMGYWNPLNSELPMQPMVENLYGGMGAQLLFVYNF